MVKPCGAQKVRDCLTYFVGLYNSVEVDEAGYIRFADGELVYRQHKGRSTPILVFQDPLPKDRFFLLNPFAGAIRTDPAVKWFLNMLSHGVATTLAITIRDAIGIALVNRKIDIGTQHLDDFVNNDSYLKVLSGKTANKKSIANEIDAQTYNEMLAIMESPEVLGNLVEFHYKGATLSTELKSPLLNEGEEFFDGKQTRRQIRPKTRRVFIKAFENLLGIDKPKEISKFTAEARDDEAARIGSWLRCQFKVLRTIMPMVEYIAPFRTVDLDAYDLWMEQLPSITARAKSVVDSYFEAPPKQQGPVGGQPQSFSESAQQPAQPPHQQPTQSSYQPGYNTPQPTPGYGGTPLPTAAGAPMGLPQPMPGYLGGQQPMQPQIFTGTHQSTGQFSFYGAPQQGFNPNGAGAWAAQPAPMSPGYSPAAFATPGQFRYS